MLAPPIGFEPVRTSVVRLPLPSTVWSPNVLTPVAAGNDTVEPGVTEVLPVKVTLIDEF